MNKQVSLPTFPFKLGRRAPALPSRSFLTLAVLGLGLTAGQNMLIGGAGGTVEAPFARAWAWAFLTAALCALSVLPFYFPQAMRRWQFAAGRGRQAWLRTYGAIAVSSLAAGLGRSWAAPLALGHPLGADRFLGLAWSLAGSCFVIGMGLEILAARWSTFRDWQVAARAQLEALARARAEVVDQDERQRRDVAEILHGEVQSHLLVMGALLERARRAAPKDPEQARGLVAEARQHLSRLRAESLQGARDMLGSGEGGCLEHGLRALVDRYHLVMPLAFKQEPGFGRAAAHLAPPVAGAALRSVEAALNNVLRHASASRVHLRAGCEAEAIVVVVQDDGVGFAPARVMPGLGHGGLGDRLEALGGSVQIASEPGRGTRVTLRLATEGP